jgi:spermidine synthase
MAALPTMPHFGVRAYDATCSHQSEVRGVIPWKLLDTAQIPDGGELRLKQRGNEYVIMLGNIVLMNSRLSGSEEALGTAAAKRLTGYQKPKLLIGGLGMGFTLRAALSALGPDASILVAELVPEVVAWAEGPMADLFGKSLRDARVRIAIGDVGNIIQSEAGGFDAILLDVDNGPDGLTRQSNETLYQNKGLNAVLKALRPGGFLGVWSQGDDDRFTRRLRQTCFDVEEIKVRADRAKRGARHTIWFAAANGRPKG